jgi:acetylornithine deacetylase/succinyl-diaminopimelate desuccinylase-like protein
MKRESTDSLVEFLKIKSISTQKEFRPDMEKARRYLIVLFEKMGFKTRTLKGKNHDAVFAQKITDKTNPTVLIYGHYDVQPPDPIEEWKTKPFEPVLKNGKIWARGASDDKGQLMAHIMAIKKLNDLTEGKLPINVKFIIEGEEEIGSISIGDIVKKYAQDLLKCDYLFVSDSEMLGLGKPTIDISLRGLAYMEIELVSAKHDLHSGQFGGVAENPAVVLSRVITKLKSEEGKILIPGFYKDVKKPSAKELKDFRSIKVSRESLKSEGGFYSIGGGEADFSLNERRWVRPTLDVNGLTSGYQGEGSKTIIPAKASAKISMRLVPDQNPEEIAKIFKSYVKKLIPADFKLRVIYHSGSLPYKAPTDNNIFNLTKECLSKAFGDQTVYDGVGGSIGFVPIVVNKLKVPCLLIGFGLPTDNVHAPNEHLPLVNYLNGIDAMFDLYSHIA